MLPLVAVYGCDLFDIFTLMFFVDESCKRAQRLFIVYYYLLCVLCQVRFVYTSAIVFVSMKNEVSD